ncbi:MAG: M48 family metalloprotease, partial [Pseudoclavibacter sp.]|nr:M48 family metalloprotease [Pseudoclavibacter sp.]
MSQTQQPWSNGAGGFPPVPGMMADPRIPAPPTLFSLTTTLTSQQLKERRHPGEIPWLIVGIVVNAIITAVLLSLLPPTVEQLVNGEPANPFLLQYMLLALFAPLVVYLVRALLYGRMRVQAVRMSPTQFPDGYRMVVEAAQAAGLRRVPDAYVVLGNGQINAFAAGHAHRRFVAVYSDLFEVGGAVRDPEALRFVIGHEVGHIAAGHTSFWRVLAGYFTLQLPVLGSVLSRAQEYTADNFGYCFAREGAPGAMAVLASGKYLNREINIVEFADRAVTERGLFPFLVNLLASHPVLSWRTHALLDRSRPGNLFLRPRRPLASGQSLPSGSSATVTWAAPAQAADFLEQYEAGRPDHFGGVEPLPAPAPAPQTPELDGRWRLSPSAPGPAGPGPAGPGPGPAGGPAGPAGPAAPGGPAGPAPAALEARIIGVDENTRPGYDTGGGPGWHAPDGAGAPDYRSAPDYSGPRYNANPESAFGMSGAGTPSGAIPLPAGPSASAPGRPGTDTLPSIEVDPAEQGLPAEEQAAPTPQAPDYSVPAGYAGRPRQDV